MDTEEIIKRIDSARVDLKFLLDNIAELSIACRYQGKLYASSTLEYAKRDLDKVEDELLVAALKLKQRSDSDDQS